MSVFVSLSSMSFFPYSSPLHEFIVIKDKPTTIEKTMSVIQN